MKPKTKLIFIILGYQLLPLLLIAAWIMPAFFDLFGVSWTDQSWRMYAATAGGWLILETPLIAFLIVRHWKRKKEEPIQALETTRGK